MEDRSGVSRGTDVDGGRPPAEDTDTVSGDTVNAENQHKQRSLTHSLRMVNIASSRK